MPVTLDFSKAQPIAPVTLDFSKAQPIAAQPGSQPAPQAEPEGFWQGLQNYVEHPEQRGAGQPNALNRFGGGIIETVGQVAQHPLNALGSTAKSVALSTPLGATLAPQAAFDNNPVVQTYRDAKQNGIAPALGHVTAGIAIGELLGKVGGAAIDALAPKPNVAGQSYTTAHAQAFEGAIAPATAMGKNFIPQNVTPEALTPIRNTAARMAQGSAVEQGTVRAATAPSTPPLERVAAYQKLVQESLADLEQQHAPALAQARNVPVDTSGLVKQLQSKISPTMDMADVSAIRNLIMRVKRAGTIGDLNTFRQELNVETAPEYKQSQVQAGRSGLSAQATSDLADMVRDAYYDNLQKATGRDFTPLKRQEANLIQTQEALQNQQASLAKAEATFAAPGTLRENIGSAVNIIKDPKTGVTQTILRESPATKISNLLRKSLTDLPAAPTSTGVPGPPVPMRPQGRLTPPPQALLPAQSSGAYPMPGNVPFSPGMSAGEQAAALNQWLRSRRQAALPANANAIPLPPPR